MKGAVILLAILGVASALQNHLEYRYHYNGTVATGIPELKGQYAAARMSAVVILQVVSQSKIIVKLEDIQVGDFNGPVDCSERANLPIHLKPLASKLAMLKEPFLVRPNAAHKNVMEVEEQEDLWVTNVRKAIINLFRVKPIIRSSYDISNVLDDQRGHRLPHFIEPETTLFGACDSIYTVSSIPEYLRTGMNMTLLKRNRMDVQSSRTSHLGNHRSSRRNIEIPPISNNFTKIVRSIDFDRCSNLVALQHSDVISKGCSLAGGQCHNLKSRSSRSEYLIRGNDETGYRIEKAVVEGVVFLSPYGYISEYVQTITNQTLDLSSIVKIEKQMRLPKNMKEIQTWMYEVSSEYQRPFYYSYEWIRFRHSGHGQDAPFSPELMTLGKEMTHEMIELVKKNVSLIMKEIVNELMAVDSSNVQSRNVSYQLYTVSRLISFMPLTDLRVLYNQVMASEQVHERKQILQSFFVDAMASSGSGPAVQVLLEKIKSTEIPAARIASIFATLSNNMVAPAVLDKLLNYAKSLNIDDHPELTSIVLINSGVLVRNLCIEPQRRIRGLPTPVFGSGVCSRYSAEEFIKYLKIKYYGEREPWKRVIYVKALANTGSAFMISTLSRTALGITENKPTIRVNAIYGLSRHNIVSTFKDRRTIMKILMTLYETWNEVPEVRQASVVAMLTWSPSTEWWKKLALSTWRDPSRQVASFVTSVLESAAHGDSELLGNVSSIASHVIPLAKPVPYSKLYSRNYMISELLYPIRYSDFADVAWLSNTKTVFPREIYLYLHKNLGGYSSTVMELVLQSDGLQKYIDKLLNIWEERKPTGERYGKVDQTMQEKARHVMTAIKEELETETRTRNKTEIITYLKFFELIQLFISTNEERLDEFNLEHFINTIKEGRNFYKSKYVRSYDLTTFLPTELGVPLLMISSMPSLFLTKGRVHLMLPKGEHISTLDELLMVKEANLTLHTNVTAQSVSIAMFKILIPWANNAVGSGVATDLYVNLPHRTEYLMNNTITSANLTVRYEPPKEHKTDFFHALNMPFTILEPIFPSENSEGKDLKPVRTRDPTDQFSGRIPLFREITGMNVFLDYCTDIDFSSTFAKFYNSIKNMASSGTFDHPWKTPSTKFWNLTATYDPLTSDNKYFIGQIAFGKNITTNVTSVNHMTKELSVERILRELKEQRSSGNSLNTTSFVAMAEFVGAQTRKYAFYGSATGYFVSPKRTFTEIVATLSRTPIPGKENLPNNMCWRAEVTKPKFSDLETRQDMLSMNFMTDIKFKTYLDSNCQSPVIAKGQGYLDMSQERKEKLNDALWESCDILDFDQALSFLRHSVYDMINVEASWTDEVPRGLQNITYKVEDFLFASYYNQLDINRNEHNQPRKFDLNGHRPLNTNKWELSVLNPRLKMNVHNLYVSPVIDTMMPMGGRTEYHHHIHEKFTTGETTKCIVSTDVIRTFDGVEIIPEFPNRCWKVAAEDCSSSKDWIVETREVTSGQPEARVYAVKDALEVIMKPGHVEVNGKVIQPVNGTQRFYDSAGTFYYLVAKDGEKVLFYLPGRIEVVINKAVQIKIAKRFAGIACGICGDRNTEAFADLTGPKFCIYNQTSMFESAWTVVHSGPEKCNQEEVIDMKKKVETYQRSCHKYTSSLNHEATKHQYEKSGLDSHLKCLAYYHSVIDKRSTTCISRHHAPNCIPGCIGQGGTRTFVDEYLCFPKEQVRPYVQNQIIPGFINHEISLYGGVPMIFDIQIPKYCVHA